MSLLRNQRNAETLLKLLVRLQQGVKKMREDLSPAVGDIIQDTAERSKRVHTGQARFILSLLATIEIAKLGVNYLRKQFERRIQTSLQKKSPSRPKLIKLPPGSRLLAIADFFCSERTMNLTVLPTVADWRKEYYVALNHQRTWKARWISVRYYFRFIKILGLDKVFSLLKSFSSAR